MRRLSLFAGISLLLHAILSLFWMKISPSLLPAPGGTGEVQVTIEMVRSEKLPRWGVSGGEPGFAPRLEPKHPALPVQGGGPGSEERDSRKAGAPLHPGTGAGGEEGTDPLLAAIRSRIERAKRYPELAQKSGVAGRALVHFRIDDSGTPAEISLRNSSGSQILDQEALATIRRAAPYPAYPEPLEVWIRFEMEN